MKKDLPNDDDPQDTTSDTDSIFDLSAALADGLKGASADFAKLATRNFWKRLKNIKEMI